LDAHRAKDVLFFPFSALLAQFGLEITDILQQYDAQKGCRPRWLCGGDADGESTFDEYFSAIFSELSEKVVEPWLLEFIQSNLPREVIPKSFTMVHPPNLNFA
jgi:hypothetical protein